MVNVLNNILIFWKRLYTAVASYLIENVYSGLHQ